MDNIYFKEYEEGIKRGASKRHCDRMLFLSHGKNVDKEINKWVNGTLKIESWFEERKDRKIILHKAIQCGIQIALDIQSKPSSLTENLKAKEYGDKRINSVGFKGQCRQCLTCGDVKIWDYPNQRKCPDGKNHKWRPKDFDDLTKEENQSIKEQVEITQKTEKDGEE